jgi:hypothetical protein
VLEVRSNLNRSLGGEKWLDLAAISTGANGATGAARDNLKAIQEATGSLSREPGVCVVCTTDQTEPASERGPRRPRLPFRSVHVPVLRRTSSYDDGAVRGLGSLSRTGHVAWVSMGAGGSLGAAPVPALPLAATQRPLVRVEVRGPSHWHISNLLGFFLFKIPIILGQPADYLELLH